jgi:hypothetical protein
VADYLWAAGAFGTPKGIPNGNSSVACVLAGAYLTGSISLMRQLLSKNGSPGP